MDPMAPHIARMVNGRAAALKSAAQSEVGDAFGLRMVEADEDEPSAYVGSDSPMALDQEFGTLDTPPAPWVIPSIERAAMEDTDAGSLP